MKKYIIKTLNGMAYGLFATLIIGVIIQQIGNLFGPKVLGNEIHLLLSKDLYNLLASLMGVGIALGIGISLKKEGLQLVVIAIAGAISTSFALSYDPFTINSTFKLGSPGNPLTAYFVTIFTIIIFDNLFKKKTPVDILIIPFGVIMISLVLTLLFSLPMDFITKTLSSGLNKATTVAPLLMVIIISVAMGMILTGPISSAAIAFTISIGGDAGTIAAGAAVVGTSIQMIGFAIQSRRDNGIGEMISIAIGTSMLQFKNIVKKPIIWLPTILSSAIIAPIVYLLGFKSTTSGAGMGTSGLVGPLQSLQAMNYSANSFISITIIVVLGGLLVYIFDKILYMKGFIKKGDLSLKENLSDN